MTTTAGGSISRGSGLRRRTGAALAALVLGTAGFTVACDPAPRPTCQGHQASIVGTAGNDTLTGTPVADIIVGLGGDDTIKGLGADDFICGGAGLDIVDGGVGNDHIDGGTGPDALHGGETGWDSVTYASGTTGVVVDLARGEGGDLDTLTGFENVVGTPANDFLIGDAGHNLLVGLDGSDTLHGGAGNDTLEDRGTSPDATNWFFGGEGNDNLHGGKANDLASYSSVPAGRSVGVNLGTGVAWGEGDDHLFDIDGAVGSSGQDHLYGNGAANTLDGRGGDDSIIGRGGDDRIVGGEGHDRASWFELYTPVTVDLGAGRATGDGTDTLVEVEGIQGGRSNDHLTGDAGTNVIDGRGGTDTCLGGGGDDYFFDCP